MAILMKSTKYRTDTGVLAMVLEDMQAASLIDLKSDKEISPSRRMNKLASRLRSNRDTQGKSSEIHRVN
jgi:hypothetical protein